MLEMSSRLLDGLERILDRCGLSLLKFIFFEFIELSLNLLAFWYNLLPRERVNQQNNTKKHNNNLSQCLVTLNY